MALLKTCLRGVVWAACRCAHERHIYGETEYNRLLALATTIASQQCLQKLNSQELEFPGRKSVEFSEIGKASSAGIRPGMPFQSLAQIIVSMLASPQTFGVKPRPW